MSFLSSFESVVGKFFSYFGAAVQVALPIVAAAGKVNPVVGVVLGILPGIMNAVNAANVPGAVKSDAVHAAAQVVFDSLSATLTGGAKESYDTYKPLYQTLIDGGVAAFKDATSVVPGAASSAAPTAAPKA
jgi:hypothetical protein